jgi:hypothetical protein
MADLDFAVSQMFGSAPNDQVFSLDLNSPRLYFGSPSPTGQYLTQGQAPTVRSNYRNAVLGRQNDAYNQWNAGGLGYVAAPITWVTSPLTGLLDMSQSYYRGRGGWVAPADRQTTDITLFAVGGMQSMASRAGALTATQRVSTQLEINAATGRSFQARVSNYGNNALDDFVEEISIRPNTATGPASFRIRADGLERVDKGDSQTAYYLIQGSF